MPPSATACIGIVAATATPRVTGGATVAVAVAVAVSIAASIAVAAAVAAATLGRRNIVHERHTAVVQTDRLAHPRNADQHPDDEPKRARCRRGPPIHCSDCVVVALHAMISDSTRHQSNKRRAPTQSRSSVDPQACGNGSRCAYQGFDIGSEIEAGWALGLIEHLVNQRHRAYPRSAVMRRSARLLPDRHLVSLAPFIPGALDLRARRRGITCAVECAHPR